MARRDPDQIDAIMCDCYDIRLTRLLNLQPCRSDHEVELPCTECGAAI